MKTSPPRAFPSNAIGEEYGGMSLLDYFAGQAMAAAWDACDKGYYDGNNEDIARCSYQLADAMMAEREKRSRAAEGKSDHG